MFAAAAPAGADTTRSVTALRVDRPPRIDGDLSEPAWREAEAAGDFFRAQQTRGTPARLRTEAYVLYDTAAIYVGFRCWEPDMAGLRETLTRRDTRVWDDDAVEVVFDTFHDRRNAYIFGINTLGTQMDQRVSNESSFTFAWDASWEAKVRKSDPTLINVNDDRELSLPERRPFFRDGAELFDLPLRLFYTRRVQEIDLGVKGTGKTGGYTWAAVNAYGRIIDRYDGDAKRRANLLNLRLNRDVGERTVIGAMAVHKHQSDRDYGLLSLNGRLGLGRDWTAAGQFAGSSTGGGPGYAYHASTNWRNQSRLSGFVELEEIGDRFRPNETGLEDEAYRRARGAITFRNEYSEGSRLNALVMRGRVFRQTEAGGRLREQYAQAEGSLDVGPFRLLFARPQRTTARSRTAVENAIGRGRHRIRVDKRFRGSLQPDRQPPGRLQLARQPRRRRQPVQPPDDRPEGAAFLLERPQGNAAPAHDDELPVHPQGRSAAVPRARDRAHLGHDGGQLQHGFRL